MDGQRKTAAIIVAAGSGKRMQSDVRKQYMLLGDKPVLFYSLDTFSKCGIIDEIILVVSNEDISYCKREIIDKYKIGKVKCVVAGGAERYLSVRSGLSAVSDDIALVMVHDGARPFISKEVICKAFEKLCTCSACVVGVPAKDTIKQTDRDGKVIATPERASLWIVQTPQCFKKALLRQAYEALDNADASPGLTDDAMLVESYTAEKVFMVEGEYTNIKITTPEDMLVAESLCSRAAEQA